MGLTIRLRRCCSLIAVAMGLEVAAADQSGAQIQQNPPVQASPVVLEGVYTGDAFSSLRGGLRQRAVYLDNLDLRFRVRGGPLLGWPGTSALVYLISNRGTNPSTYVGDAQGVSNIATKSGWRLYEAWVQQNLASNRLSLLLGLYDLNTEFDAIQSAGLFLNSSFGIGPDYSQSGRNGPSIFPVTSLGLRVKYRPSPQLYVATAILDGVPGDPDDLSIVDVSLNGRDGALVAAEIAAFTGVRESGALTTRPGARTRHRQLGRGATATRYAGKVALGAWAYTSRAPQLVGPDSTISFGAYVIAERTLYREPGRDDGLTVFGRLGAARTAVNRFGSYVGAGAVYSGLIPGRPDDEVGLAIAVARNGGGYRQRSLADGRDLKRAESALELTYRAQVLPSFAVQPDIQWVIHPNTDPVIRNALVFGVRGEVSLTIP